MLNDITVFDFETTGFSGEKDRVIEMAAIRVIDGQVVTGFHALINPQRVLPEKITEITGITDVMLKDAIDTETAFKLLRNIMKGSTLVAHNALFDLAFLHHNFMRIYGQTFNNDVIDTLTISRARTSYPHKLTDMCDKYGIVLEGAHRALNDVEACYELLMKLNQEKSVDEYVNKLGYLSKFGAPKWYPSHTEVFSH